MPMPNADAEVTLREITRETLRQVLALKVGSEQERFVAPNAVSIAEAYFWPGIAWFRAIYADDTPVGFLMLEDNPEKPEYSLWRLMVDERFQDRGYGRRAVELLIEYVRTRPGAIELFTSHVPGDDGPGRFYERMGFVLTGEVEDDELVMRLEL